MIREEACTMSDRVLILNQGRIAQYDTPENIIEHPASDFVRDFHPCTSSRSSATTSTRCSLEDQRRRPLPTPARREPALVRA